MRRVGRQSKQGRSRMSGGAQSCDADDCPVSIDLRQATMVRGIEPPENGVVTVAVETPAGESRLVVPVPHVQQLVSLLLLLVQSSADSSPEPDARHVVDLSIVPT